MEIEKTLELLPKTARRPRRFAHASGMDDGGSGIRIGPNGVNIGIDFNWNHGPAGYTASFIANTTGSGATLNKRTGGPTTPTSTACDFVFSYSIGVLHKPLLRRAGFMKHIRLVRHHPNAM